MLFRLIGLASSSSFPSQVGITRRRFGTGSVSTSMTTFWVGMFWVVLAT